MGKDVRYEPQGTMATSVGRRLRELRKAAGLTQSQLGLSLGVKPQQVSKYESGTDNLGLENLAKAARLFRVTTDELLGHDPGFDDGPATPFEPAPAESREAVQRLVATLEDVLTQVRELDLPGRALATTSPQLNPAEVPGPASRRAPRPAAAARPRPSGRIRRSPP